MKLFTLPNEPGRLFVQFSNTPADEAAAREVRSCGANYVPELGLYRVPITAHERLNALALVYGADPEPCEYRPTVAEPRALSSGWLFLSADARGVLFENPTTTGKGPILISWAQLQAPGENVRPAARAALAELYRVALNVYPDGGKPVAVPSGSAPTPAQLASVLRLLEQLAEFSSEYETAYRPQVNAITTRDEAGALLRRLAGLLSDERAVQGK